MCGGGGGVVTLSPVMKASMRLMSERSRCSRSKLPGCATNMSYISPACLCQYFYNHTVTYVYLFLSHIIEEASKHNRLCRAQALRPDMLHVPCDVLCVIKS